MMIGKHSVVSIHYTLTDDDGDILDSSAGQDPMEFLFGAGMIVPGLEQAMLGRSIGDTFEVSVSPEDGYGLYDEDLVIEVMRSQFDLDSEVELGMLVEAADDDGEVTVFTVVDADEEVVTLDGNHPLAGEQLNFAVSIEAVRGATLEEIEHGHVH